MICVNSIFMKTVGHISSDNYYAIMQSISSPKDEYYICTMRRRLYVSNNDLIEIYNLIIISKVNQAEHNLSWAEFSMY